MDKNQHKNINDLLKESFGNYEVSYQPGDWLDMEKKLDLFEKGKSNWFKKSSIYTKLIAGALLITAFVVYYLNNEKNRSINKHSTEESIALQSDEATTSSLYGQGITSKEPVTIKKETGNLWGKRQSRILGTENLRGDSNAAGKEKSYIPVDKNNNLITSFLNNEPANDKTGKPEVPWLGMLRGVYVEKNRQFPVPSASFTTSITGGCNPLIVEFNADNTDVPKAYMWSFGDGYYSNEPNPKHLYEQNGIYDITLRVTSLMNEKTVSNTIKNKITVYLPPEAIFDWDRKEPTITNRPINFIDQSKDAVQWLWDFGDNETSNEQNPLHIYYNAGTFKVVLIVKNAFGCYDTAYSYITINGKIKNEKLYAPTAFSPNGDGINDVFLPVAIGLSESEFEMSIHDRNGNLIYETKNINEPWDGKITGNGRTAEESIYIWLVIIKDKYGKQYKYVGHVTLLK